LPVPLGRIRTENSTRIPVLSRDNNETDALTDCTSILERFVRVRIATSQKTLTIHNEIEYRQNYYPDDVAVGQTANVRNFAYFARR